METNSLKTIKNNLNMTCIVIINNTKPKLDYKQTQVYIQTG